jgi:lipocalin
MKINIYIASFIATLTLMSCGENETLETVDQLDLEKYQGTWFELARLPNSFEKGLTCVTANYTIKDNGKVEVINRGHKESDPSKIKESKGTAWVPNPDEPGQLKVRFFWPFAGDYYVIKLGPDYKYALVGSPSREYLWILCRNRRLDGPTINELLELAAARGFDVEQLEWVGQSCS